jgi:hypothetical protein
LDRLHDVLDEARKFLDLPRAEPALRESTALPGSPKAARRLLAMSRPIAGTIAETYLRRRGITAVHGIGPLRFHPRCYYRPHEDAPTETWPALIAAVTDLAGTITGAHRTWLDPSGHDKAPVATPRRAMGHLLGHAVRFGVVHDVMAAGEGIETMLSLRSILPTMPIAAALSANHLAAILFPATLRRLYVARDRDPAGDTAMATLTERARTAGIEARSACRRRLAISMKICGAAAATIFARACGLSLPRKTWPDSWRQRWRPEPMDEVTLALRIRE